MQKQKRVRNRGTTVEFICDKENCGHTYDLLPYEAKKQSCPYCAKKRLCKNISCKICFDRSFASSNRALSWYHNKNRCDQRDCFKTSGKRYWFMCDNNNCKHLFQSRLADITDGSWCPYCANKKLCCAVDCQICSDKSVQSHPYFHNWSSLNKESPRSIRMTTHKKYWFTCESNQHNILLTLRNINITKNPKMICTICNNE